MTLPFPPVASVRGGRPARRAAFTLVELLVASTMALVVMAALASLFGIFSRAVNNSQKQTQLAAGMRSAAWRLRQDLQGVTTEVKPFIRPESAAGYFELIEGPDVDTGDVGDADDILMLTTASPGRPFRGLISLTTATTTAVQTIGLESPVAEVAWFCKKGTQTDEGVQLYNLYRRQLLVAPTPGAGMLATTSTTVIFTGTGLPSAWDVYFRSNDLSVRREDNTLIANSLADLTRRHSRFMHNVCGVMSLSPRPFNATTGTVTHTLTFSWPQITTTSTIPGASDVLTGPREGEDLILANVIAFDVRVFDPERSGYFDLGSGTSSAATPTILSGTPALSGTGVPLLSATSSQISSPLRLAAPTATSSGTSVIRMVQRLQSSGSSYKFYDTWSMDTEWNNITDWVSTANTLPFNGDRGTNWDDGTEYASNGYASGNVLNGVVDDVGELEQPPPYAVPLRGVEIRIRCYEPASKEVRQITVQHSFLDR